MYMPNLRDLSGKVFTLSDFVLKHDLKCFSIFQYVGCMAKGELNSENVDI